MKRLFFGALLLALAISVPIATMAQVTSPLLEGSLKDSVTGMEFVFIKGG